MFALIFKNKVIQIENKKFPVAPELIWIECDNSIKVGYDYINDNFINPFSETTEQKKARIKNELITLRQAFLDKTFREAVEYLLSEQKYPNKEKREKAIQEINDIQNTNTLTALSKFDTVFE